MVLLTTEPSIQRRFLIGGERNYRSGPRQPFFGRDDRFGHHGGHMVGGIDSASSESLVWAVSLSPSETTHERVAQYICEGACNDWLAGISIKEIRIR